MAAESIAPSFTGNLAVELPSDNEVRVTRVFNAPRKLVFEVWTECRHLQRWLLGPEGWTMPECEVDARPGGRWYHLWRGSGGEQFSMSGEFKEVVPYERIVNTEIYEENPPSINTLALVEENGKTTAILTMKYISKEVRDMVLGTGMTDGMDVSFNRLDEYLSGEVR